MELRALESRLFFWLDLPDLPEDGLLESRLLLLRIYVVVF